MIGARIEFAPSVFVQLQAIRKERGNEAAILYNDILRCLSGEMACPMIDGRGGRKRLALGPYRAIVEPADAGYLVLRVYRAAGA